MYNKKLEIYIGLFVGSLKKEDMLAKALKEHNARQAASKEKQGILSFLYLQITECHASFLFTKRTNLTCMELLNPTV